MEDRTKTYAAAVAVILVGVSAMIHLVAGVTELSAVLSNSGTVAYAALMLVGVAIPVVLLGAMAAGVVRPRATYGMLSGVMVLYVIAYADVHALGYIESITGAELHSHDHSHDDHGHNGHDDHGHNGHDDHGHDDHDHGDSAVDTVIDHLADDPVALIAKISEGTAAVLFGLLAVRTE